MAIRDTISPGAYAMLGAVLAAMAATAVNVWKKGASPDEQQAGARIAPIRPRDARN